MIQTNMKNKNTLRELMLDLCEVGETMNAYGYALKMMKALSNKEITSEQFKLLAGDLQIHCQREKIETSNEICSLF
jgi:hypothetical protein